MMSTELSMPSDDRKSQTSCAACQMACPITETCPSPQVVEVPDYQPVATLIIRQVKVLTPVQGPSRLTHIEHFFRHTRIALDAMYGTKSRTWTLQSP